MTEHENLASALVAALADLTIVEKGRTAKIEKKTGGHYSYDYADIGDVVKLTRPVLATHGLVALTPVHGHGNGLACTVVILHTSGERLDFDPLPFEGARDAQATGSAITYFRRFALVAALGMAAGDDDDGASAKASQTAPRRQEQPRGITPKEAGDKVQAVLTETTGMTGDKLTNHAKQVWREVAPKAVGGMVPDDEVARLLAAARDLGETLEALARDEAYA